jgi:hypothetical protein
MARRGVAMSYTEILGKYTVAISTSESPDMLALGMSDEHLKDAMAEIARHLLALGVRLVYGGDLRSNGFSELLFELVARHRRDADADDQRVGVVNYLAWPVHIRMAVADIEQAHSDLIGTAELICLGLDGSRQSLDTRRQLPQQQPTEAEWCDGLTAMRKIMLCETQARVVLGGRVEQYKGVMPGIAEEALLSLQVQQPLFVIGGFGGCARDISEAMHLVQPWTTPRREWPGRDAFGAFVTADLNNGLTAEENATLARTPHIDQAITLILRGLMSVGAPTA